MPKRPLPDILNSKIVVVGQGYVGLPLTVALANEFNLSKNSKTLIIGYDNSTKRIQDLENKVDETGELDQIRDLKLPNLTFSSEINSLLDKDVYIIAVPTPVDKINKPDLHILKNATKTVAEAIKNSKDSQKCKCIIYESTVYPGATEEICLPIIEKITDKKVGDDITIGYSPERINPADKNHRLNNIVKIVSGLDEETLDYIEKIYCMIVKVGIHRASSIKVAEAAKVIENIQRDLNIALVNELSIIFNKLNINTSEVLDAAATKWNFVRYAPGLVGGHCIGVDPYYLTYKAETVGYHPEVILAGRRINDSMGSWIATLAIKKLLSKNNLLSNQIKVAIFGFTYKSNCPDIRNTKVNDIYKSLNEFGCAIDVTDPHANKNSVLDTYQIDLIDEENIISKKEYDLVFITVEHSSYKNKNINDWKSIIKENGLIIDIKNMLIKDESVIKI